MARGVRPTAVHLEAGGAGGVGQLRCLGLGCEVQGLGGLLGTQKVRVRDTKEGHPLPHCGTDRAGEKMRLKHLPRAAKRERMRAEEKGSSSAGEGTPHSGQGSTCRGWWVATPGLFTTGAGGLCSSCSGYSTVERKARGKVPDET